MKKYLNSRFQEGFTLIEIVIVIAIAALILAGVLVFVPTAQKNRRDTARKDLIGKIAAIVESSAANNGGAYPSLATLNTLVSNAGLKDPSSGATIVLATGSCTGTGPGVGVWNYQAATGSAGYKVCTTTEDTTIVSN